MIIDGNKITADEGKLLLRKADNLLFGKELTLGYTHYINGERVNPPHLEVPEDYRDSDYIEVDGTAVAVDGFDYAYLKDRIVKLRYSPEDQIAIICNRELDVENAEEVGGDAGVEGEGRGGGEGMERKAGRDRRGT